MTTQKKLISIGVITGIIFALSIFLPGGIKGKFLGSTATGTPISSSVCAYQNMTQTFGLTQFETRIIEQQPGLVARSYNKYNDEPILAVSDEQVTKDHVCQVLGFQTALSSQSDHWAGLGDNSVLVWDSDLLRFVHRDANPTTGYRFVTELTCTKPHPNCVVSQCTDTTPIASYVGFIPGSKYLGNTVYARTIVGTPTPVTEVNVCNILGVTLADVIHKKFYALFQHTGTAVSMEYPIVEITFGENYGGARTSPYSGQNLYNIPSGNTVVVNMVGDTCTMYIHSLAQGDGMEGTVYLRDIGLVENAKCRNAVLDAPASFSTPAASTSAHSLYATFAPDFLALPICNDTYDYKICSNSPTLTGVADEGGNVDLSWTAPTENNGGTVITDYMVEYKLSSVNTWTVAGDGIGKNPHAVITGLSGGNSYDFRVSAENIYGAKSIASNTVTLTPPYIITSSAGTGGTIFPASVGVNLGDTTTFTVTPNPGYRAAVTGCEGSLSDNVYTTGPITTVCIVNADFVLNSAVSCTGTRPLNSTIKQDISTSTISRAWAFDPSPTGPYNLCTFQCNSGTTYNSVNNTCNSNVITHTVTYNGTIGTGGNVPTDASSPYASGTTVTVLGNTGNLTKTGYNFAGWNTQENGSGTSYAAGATFTMGTTDIILYAKWTAVADTTPPTITVTSSNTTPLALGETTTLTFTLSTISTNFAQDDITVVGGTLSGWTATSGTVYTAVFTPAANRTTAGTIDVATGTFTDASGVSNTAMTQLSLQIDTVAPSAPAVFTIPAQTGVSVSTGLVYVRTPTLLVSVPACPVGETLKFYNGASFTPLKEVPCTGAPITNVQIDLSTSETMYAIFMTLTDAAGNISGPSVPTIYLIKDTSSNSAPGVPDMDPLYDFGSSSSDNLTRETRPRFLVACFPGNNVSLYDGPTDLIGTGPCMNTTVGGSTEGTAQIIPTIDLSASTHSISARQINPTTGTVSPASAALSVTINTTPLLVALSKAPEQTNPASTTTLKFIATFNRPINTNSFVCSDVTVVNGVCNSISASLTSSNIFTITILATNPGIVKIFMYAGRVETPAGNLNTESTGTNTVTYGVGTNGQCSSLRTFPASNPTSASLNNQTLCVAGTKGTVSYSGSRQEWTYACSGTNGGTNATCTVGTSYDSACDLKPVDELPFESCDIGTRTGFFKFHEYLSCLNIVDEKASCNDAGCTLNAKRQDLIYIASRIRGIPLDLTSDYECQRVYTDTVSGVPPWVCEVAEKANIAGLITGNNRSFRPLETMTRAEAFKVILGSICSYPTATTNNWQTDVAKQAIKLGFSTRTVGTFEPSRPLLRQELYTIAARAAQWLGENPDNCALLPEELICE